ncbi:MAG TPA: TonB-dependent receptor, partial [Candidatus Acidoferrales bacterium]|nr:TonB-dependent receptor [Candidatus Acidoferrales bacterium]
LGRIDYNVSSKHKLFTRFNFNNQKNADDRNNISPATGIPASVAFPNDPPTAVDTENDKAWVIGDTWTITPNTINQFVYGETRGQADFGIAFNPNGTNFQFAWMDSAVDPPYLRQSTQSHIIPVPTFRDDWSQIHGSHSLAFGGVFKPIRTRDVQVNDFNFIGLGLNPLTPSLSTTSPTPSLRPANILNDPALDPSGVALSDWDNAFMNMLGSWWLDVGVFNYNKSGTALGLGVPHRVDYRYYEYEFYGQDSWRVTKSLTLTYGLRYQYDSVPYESKGLEGVSTVTFQQEFSPRVANGMNGVSTFEPSPFLTYALGGKANPGAPSLYKSDPTNFSPRLAIAWNPSGSSGLLGKWLGDRKTVFRGSASLIYDHTALNSINFIQDQNSFLFSTQAGGQFGGAGAFTDLATDPRFTGINDLPVSAQTPPVAPPFVNPLTPNVVSGGVAVGQVSGIDNYTVDQNFKTPYALAFSADMQRELRGGVQLDVGWVGRYGRRLIALADANQLVDFNDAGANQSLFQAISALEVEARANVVTPTEQPIFEDPNFCLELEPAAETCTQFIYSNFFRPLQLGGLGSIVNAMNSNLFSATADWGFTPGAGQSSQFQSNVYLTNKGWSSYNGLLITLRKRFSHNLQGDFNYTFAHSLDNISLIADNIGNQAGTSPGVLCDVRSGKVCRGNSEFDLTHSIVADVIYALPFGRGQWMGKDASIWLDELIGGWGISDITSWRSGFPYNAFSGVQTTSLFADSIGIFDGNRAAIATHRHVNPVDKTVQIFANQAAAIGAFGPPTGQQVGQRNVLRGPRFSSWDMALTKKFDLGTERCGLELRMEAYNVFNHTNFALPDNAITSAQFGVISNTAGTPRQMQFALRFTF